jgi:serine/threonine-protein kinase RsbW
MLPAPDQGHGEPGLRLVFVADPPTVRDRLARVMAAPLASGLSADLRGKVELVLAEVLNNVVEHAYSFGSGHVELTIWGTAEGLVCEVVDAGAPMPGGRLPEGRLPDGAGLSAADQPEGGFGWHLIRKLTRDLAYARAGGQNRLTFTVPFTTQT